ncbi:MAG: UDP-N-acetylmuramate--L-alanine ligase [Flavobacteriales bacterium]|nr:UDP-N-acetylmuramate--L-alanine ligase [Flavobacteriales bacterium]MCX7768356.1 UDP-N-acetylmuramate--L-alanine ligase [Flavobacteriales bacterium]MDW8409084.1 UDP-N-acetylmuramate--L-alanine ligase [Flavobacteriales bacterium]
MKLVLEHIHYVYMIGAGGIGMSALGRYFLNKGCRVAGYDKTPSPLTERLIREGMEIHFEDDPIKIPVDFKKASRDEVLVIYTPAIPGDHQELSYFRTASYHILKRAEVLGILTAGTFNISVAGAHGKTTTTAFTAHIFSEAGRSPMAFLGGLLSGKESNFIPGNGSLTITEADEYDRSFLHLEPSVAVVTALEPDHLDVYGSEEKLVSAYQEFVSRIRRGGRLVASMQAWHALQGKSLSLPSGVETITYGLEAEADYRITEISGSSFVLNGPSLPSTRFTLPMPGRHNALNAAAATIVALGEDIEVAAIEKALAKFPGLRRRLEKITAIPGLVYYDDYAHHPTELEACIEALRQVDPQAQLTGIFQPHLYSRTRDFAEGFARALDALDTVILMPIYAAREEPIPGVSASLIFENMKNPRKYMAGHSEVIPLLEQLNPSGILATLGAGDIDRLVEPIRRWMNMRKTAL